MTDANVKIQRVLDRYSGVDFDERAASLEIQQVFDEIVIEHEVRRNSINTLYEEAKANMERFLNKAITPEKFVEEFDALSVALKEIKPDTDAKPLDRDLLKKLKAWTKPLKKLPKKILEEVDIIVNPMSRDNIRATTQANIIIGLHRNLDNLTGGEAHKVVGENISYVTAIIKGIQDYRNNGFRERVDKLSEGFIDTLELNSLDKFAQEDEIKSYANLEVAKLNTEMSAVFLKNEKFRASIADKNLIALERNSIANNAELSALVDDPFSNVELSTRVKRVNATEQAVLPTRNKLNPLAKKQIKSERDKALIRATNEAGDAARKNIAQRGLLVGGMLERSEALFWDALEKESSAPGNAREELRIHWEEAEFMRCLFQAKLSRYDATMLGMHRGEGATVDQPTNDAQQNAPHTSTDLDYAVSFLGKRPGNLPNLDDIPLTEQIQNIDIALVYANIENVLKVSEKYFDNPSADADPSGHMSVKKVNDLRLKAISSSLPRQNDSGKAMGRAFFVDTANECEAVATLNSAGREQFLQTEAQRCAREFQGIIGSTDEVSANASQEPDSTTGAVPQAENSTFSKRAEQFMSNWREAMNSWERGDTLSSAGKQVLGDEIEPYLTRRTVIRDRSKSVNAAIQLLKEFEKFCDQAKGDEVQSLQATAFLERISEKIQQDAGKILSKYHENDESLDDDHLIQLSKKERGDIDKYRFTAATRKIDAESLLFAIDLVQSAGGVLAPEGLEQTKGSLESAVKKIEANVRRINLNLEIGKIPSYEEATAWFSLATAAQLPPRTPTPDPAPLSDDADWSDSELLRNPPRAF